MRNFFSFCFDQLTDPLSLPIDPITEYIILAFIGLLAYMLAYRLVGIMYDANAISGSLLGSIFHWSLRFIIFVSLWGLTNGAIAVYRFVVNHWVVLIALGGVSLLTAIFFFVRHFLIQNRLKAIKETVQKP